MATQWSTWWRVLAHNWRAYPKIDPGIPAPDSGGFGPTNGAQHVRSNAGRRNLLYTATPGATTITTSMTLSQAQTAITNAGVGADIDFEQGVKLHGSLTYYRNQTWTGLGTGATITGASTVTPTLTSTPPPGSAVNLYEITGVTNLGSATLSGATTQERPVRGVDPSGMAQRKNQVFWDNVKLWQVTSVANLTAVDPPYGLGNFYHDTARNTIYLDPALGDPLGHTVEISDIGTTLVIPDDTSATSTTTGFTMQNMIVEKAGNSTHQNAGINLRNNGHLIDVKTWMHHGGGVHQQQGCVIEHSTISNNGQIGVHGGPAESPAQCGHTGIVLKFCEVGFNNDAGYNWAWEAGSTKWLYTEGLTVQNNWFHDSYGDSGYWADGPNVGVLVEENVIEDGAGMGINHELGPANTTTPGDGIIVRNNYVANVGHEHPSKNGSFGGGIYIDQSRSGLITGNDVYLCQAGIVFVQEPAGTYCSYLSSNTLNHWVHDNRITQHTGQAAGLQTLNEPSPGTYYTVANIRYEQNTYVLDSLATNRFRWDAGLEDTSAWSAEGQDVGSTYTVG